MSSPRFFGIFETLRDMDLPRTEVTDLYSGFYALVYDQLTSSDDWDLPLYRRLATASKGRILELGCGSGRISLPLAQDGHRIVGLDLSKDMITLLHKKLAHESEEVRDRVRLINADMTSFSLTDKFDLILLPVNNISLLSSDGLRLALFNCVARHLTSSGYFAFDFLVPDQERLLKQNRDLIMIPGTATSIKQFILSAQLYIPEEELQILNFYCELIDQRGMTKRFLGSTTKAITTETKLVALLTTSGFRIVDVYEYEPGKKAEQHRLMKLFVCERTL